ncbi:MAG: hypothetical protein RL119_719 [Actinomycetota bacterium]
MKPLKAPRAAIHQVLVPLTALALIAAGCSGDSDSETGGADAIPVFAQFDDCADVLEWTKAEMLKRVGPYGLETYPWMYASGLAETGRDVAVSDPAMGVPAMEDSSAPSDGKIGLDTSVTNTQEIDVDEGDIVETDGRFIYSIIDNRLRSVDLDTNTLLNEIDLPLGESQMILNGDRLIVVNTSWDVSASAIMSQYSIDNGQLTFERRDHLEGWLVSIRAVDGVAFLTLRSPLVERIDFVSPRDGTEESLEAAEERNREVIEELTIEQLLPRTFEESEMGSWGSKSVAVDCANLGHPEQFSGWGVTWVASVPMEEAPAVPVASVGILADSNNAYASTNSLYVATTRWSDTIDEEYVPNRPQPPQTDIHAFELTKGTTEIKYVASGRVSGTLLNSYSMSEFDGALRVATTTYEYDFGGGQDNGVHILQVDGRQLKEVGSVTGLGRGEQIQGVRFDGSRGYVVTFRQVDPLYVLDLSDPVAPELVGELKIPGYSTYLKPIDGDRVIGVGMSGTETGQITGAQVSLFDVSDPSNPVLIASREIGEMSEATWDPHAILWWSATGQIVVPRELVCDEAGGTGCESAVVLQLSGKNLDEQGRIFQWFPIRRAVIAQNRLVTVSAGGVLVMALDTLTPLSEVRFDIPGIDTEDDLPPLVR